MLHTFTTTRAAATALFVTLLASSSTNAQAVSSVGCYSSAPNLVFADSYLWQTSSHCQPLCIGKGKAVMGLTKGSDCYCGDELPPASQKTDKSACNKVCDGFGNDTCGSLGGAFDIYLSGINLDVGTASGDSSDESSSPPSSSPSSSSSTSASLASSAPSLSSTVPPVQTIIAAQAPLTVTASASPTTAPASVITVGATIVRTVSGEAVSTTAPMASSAPTANPQPSGGSKIGLAVGIVVGVIAGIALILGIFFLLKRRHSTSVAERHRRLNSVNAFANAGSPPAYTTNDSRLDQTMVERRNSTGSIFADNEDYSRRILKVTNPDRS